ncbi:molybdenum cofactor guanylyltransferase [Paenibacillus sp. GCM10027626]|uniref:molybdenum cofactor guanylyltransferase n=1 Tax=Paenibacillus sp. GCM10027626 TaxID=3273411 RepID=UPI003627CAD3
MLSGVLLAGGENRGMNGANRALLKLGDETFLERQLQQLGKCCDDITIVTTDPSSLLRIVDRSVRIITDYFPVKGPLSGMHAGLALAKHDDVWIVGCHMPCISAAAAELMVEEKRRTGCDAVLPQTGTIDDLLHGIYDKRCSETIGQLLDAGRSQITELLQLLSWRGLPESYFRQRWIDPKFVTGIHNEEDYNRLLADIGSAS